MGLPLIAGDTGDQSIEYLNANNNIVVLENRDITEEKLIVEINNIINNPSTLEAMKLGAKEATQKYLNWNNLIWKTLRFVKKSEVNN